MNDPFEYRLPGRRPATLVGFAATTALLAVAAYSNAPIWIWIGWGGFALALLWAVVRNPVHGCRVDGARLSWFRNKSENSVRLAEIARIEFRGWSKACGACRILMKDGSAVEPPAPAMPPAATFEAVLREHGVSVRRP